EDNFKVPKLLADGSNWVTYKDRLRWALDAHGMLDQLEKNIPEPLTPAELSSTKASPALPATPGYKIRYEKWWMAEATIKQCIASTVPDSVFNRVKAKKSAKDVWDAVAAIFEDRLLLVAINL
ncbi:hypothetical protein BDZ94DRAFT_1138953, partial [Collybia nuda]